MPSLKLSNPFRRDADRPSLKERAAALKATAGRVMRRRSADQPSPATLPSAPGVDHGHPAFPGADPGFHHGLRDLANDPNRDGAAGSGGQHLEAAMGRHEIFKNAVPLTEDLFSSTSLEAMRARGAPAGAVAAMAPHNPGMVPYPAAAPTLVVLPEPMDRLCREALPSSDLADACVEQVERLRLWDENPSSLSEEDGDAEMDRWGAIFRRAIEEPSASPRDLAGKAFLMLEDLDRFFPEERHNTSNFKLLRVIMREAIAMGGLGHFDAMKAVGTVSLGVAPLTTADPDADLLALEVEFIAAHRAERDADALGNAAWEQYEDPQMPVALWPEQHDWIFTSIPRPGTIPLADGRRRVRPYGAEQVEQMRGLMHEGRGIGGNPNLAPDRRAQERGDAIVAAWDQWQAEIAAAKEALGLPALEAAHKAAKDRRAPILERLRETPARSLAGLGVKARVAFALDDGMDPKERGLEDYDSAEPEAFVYGVAGDVLALTARPTAEG